MWRAGSCSLLIKRINVAAGSVGLLGFAGVNQRAGEAGFGVMGRWQALGFEESANGGDGGQGFGAQGLVKGYPLALAGFEIPQGRARDGNTAHFFETKRLGAELFCANHVRHHQKTDRIQTQVSGKVDMLSGHVGLCAMGSDSNG